LPPDGTLSSGVGTFVASLKTAGPQTLTATDSLSSSITGVSGGVAVSAAAATHFTVVAPPSAVTGAAITATVTALDAFGNTAVSYAGAVHITSSDAAAVLPSNGPLTNGVGAFSVTLNTTGSQTVSAVDSSTSSITGVSGAISVRGLTVSTFTTTPTGFTVTFSKPFNPNVINLYDAASANFGPADVVLAGQLAANNPVKGSLLIDPSNTTITFVKTSGVLTPDAYTVTLVSGANAFKDASGISLDGNNSGVPGTNYTTTFTVTASSAVVVSVPSFARGPDAGHNINVPNSTTGGIPLKLSNGNGVTDVTLTVNYDPTLLTVSGAAANPALSGATLTLGGASTPGHAVLVFHSPTALAAGAITLGGLTAQVPDNAPYRNKALLDLSAIQINSGAIPAVAQDGVQAVAYFGDASGNGTFSGLDVSLISRVSSKLDSGFAAFRLLDPVIVADINNNGRIDSNDAAQLAQFLTNNASVPAIPPIPASAPTIVPGGPDPTLSIPSGLHAAPGDVLSVPVVIDDAHPAGSTGATEVSLALRYDPAVLTASAADVHLGALPAGGAGWSLQAAVDPVAGAIGVELFSVTPLAASSADSLVTIDFQVLPDAAPGTTSAQLVGDVLIAGRSIRTEVDDNQGAFTLRPAPTDAAPVGAAITVAAAQERSGPAASAFVVGETGNGASQGVSVEELTPAHVTNFEDVAADGLMVSSSTSFAAAAVESVPFLPATGLHDGSASSADSPLREESDETAPQTEMAILDQALSPSGMSWMGSPIGRIEWANLTAGSPFDGSGTGAVGESAEVMDALWGKGKERSDGVLSATDSSEILANSNPDALDALFAAPEQRANSL
jgi:hypothetical protein